LLLTVLRQPDTIPVALNKKSAQKQKAYLKQPLLASGCFIPKLKRKHLTNSSLTNINFLQKSPAELRGAFYLCLRRELFGL
jgi:hypothetical protein